MNTRTMEEAYTYLRINKDNTTATALTLKRLLNDYSYEHHHAESFNSYLGKYSSLIQYSGKPEIRRAIVLEEMS